MRLFKSHWQRTEDHAREQIAHYEKQIAALISCRHAAQFNNDEGHASHLAKRIGEYQDWIRQNERRIREAQHHVYPEDYGF